MRRIFFTLLVPAQIDTPSILVGTQFLEIPKDLDFPPCLADLCDKNRRPGRIQLWNGWDFLVVTSPLKCRILSPIPLSITELSERSSCSY